MPHTSRNPAAVSGPDGLFSHGCEVGPGARWLHVTGQVGVDADGRLAETPEEQCRLAFANVMAILDEAGMSAQDLVKVTAYLVDPQHVEAYRAARDLLLVAPYPTSTVVVVAGLVLPEFLVEIEGVAAQG